MPEQVVFPGLCPPKDGAQPLWRGGLVGCGALSAATLLRVQAERRGLDLPPRDELAGELAAWQGAFRVPLTGGWRATWPWRWLSGVNGALIARGLPLRARGLWGCAEGLPWKPIWSACLPKAFLWWAWNSAPGSSITGCCAPTSRAASYAPR
ncbi:hypothetical protein [Deinococcus multiflagellatus]|uniref:Uncharacterized protein n=1 Tax=Deinococcus multiflagellatus TaxID=1656887 RepID=A0ABW1ZMA7_9DEIO